ncbi:alpha-hydroxy-acid oxidizing protein [Diaphorobacter sp. HDW4A]|uniref:alpha-hydroxy acid oxidase n=1 Tax=Diaphorobacter sp. HDW4A TaxID=2714924 RepID=UPI00140DC86D|nr:alpha-hydroxy acid oxidase [Diaphorobacter sp. HDW4A]QIL83607.1 alpha-hydroxy-acid oxidizing protein [Diaphorobacter sp. HDW4A]
MNALGEPVRPAWQRVPADIMSLSDYERHALHHVERASWAHIACGADQELSVAHNRAAFDAIRLVPEPLPDLSDAHTRVDLLGKTLRSPVLLAPVAYQRLMHPDGELATVRAAMAMQTAMMVSTLATHTIEDIAQAAEAARRELGRGAPLYFQLYSQPERSTSLNLVRRAETAGYEAVVWTVDANIKRSRFPLPPGVEAINLRGSQQQPTQTSDLTSEHILFGTPLAHQAPGWDELVWLRAQTRLPLVVKGILSASAAKRAVELGADAIVVSNHGGRVLDGVVSPIDVLPAIRAAVPASIPLIVDSGVRLGTDVVKAIAFGATAVMVGRPQLHALATAGMLGVAHMLHLLRSELELAMAQTGCATLSQISPTLLACTDR